jgi:hypothetical protein
LRDNRSLSAFLGRFPPARLLFSWWPCSTVMRHTTIWGTCMKLKHMGRRWHPEVGQLGRVGQHERGPDAPAALPSGQPQSPQAAGQACRRAHQPIRPHIHAGHLHMRPCAPCKPYCHVCIAQYVPAMSESVM